MLLAPAIFVKTDEEVVTISLSRHNKLEYEMKIIYKVHGKQGDFVTNI